MRIPSPFVGRHVRPARRLIHPASSTGKDATDVAHVVGSFVLVGVLYQPIPCSFEI